MGDAGREKEKGEKRKKEGETRGEGRKEERRERERGGDMGRDRRAGGGGRSNKAINRDLGIGRQGPGLARAEGCQPITQIKLNTFSHRVCEFQTRGGPQKCLSLPIKCLSLNADLFGQASKKDLGRESFLRNLIISNETANNNQVNVANEVKKQISIFPFLFCFHRLCSPGQ